MTMMIDPEISARYARERYRDAVTMAQRERLARAYARPMGLTRLAARPLGRALSSVGAWLLRYGKVESSTTMQSYRVSSRSIELN